MYSSTIDDDEALCHAYFDGRMTLAEEKAFFEHLFDNPRLCRCFEDYLSVHQALRTHVPQEPSPSLEARIMARIREDAAVKRPSVLRVLGRSPVAAALLGVAVVSTLLITGGPSPEFSWVSTRSLPLSPTRIAEAPLTPVSATPVLERPATARPIEAQLEVTVEEAWHDVGTLQQDLSYLAAESEWLDPDGY